MPSNLKFLVLNFDPIIDSQKEKKVIGHSLVRRGGHHGAETKICKIHDVDKGTLVFGFQ